MPPLSVPTRAVPDYAGWVAVGRGYTRRLRVAGVAVATPAPPLAVADPALVGRSLVELHCGALDQPGFDLAITGPLAVTLSRFGMVWQEGHLLTSAEILPDYVMPQLHAAPAHFFTGPRALPCRAEHRPGFVFSGWGMHVFGHFLIETLPRLLLARALPHWLDGALPVLDRAMPDWLQVILREQFGIGESNAIWFDSRIEQLDLARAWLIPNLLRPGGFHPLAAGLLEAFGQGLAGPAQQGGARLFIARGDYHNPHSAQRCLENEAALAAMAEAEFGCTVVYPQDLSFTEQVACFSRAELVLGQAGSAPHLALFAPKGARVGVLRFMAPDQSFIAALRGQKIGYLTEGISETAPGQFRIDPEKFRMFGAAMLAID